MKGIVEGSFAMMGVKDIASNWRKNWFSASLRCAPQILFAGG
jgi:hypothetical protein